MSAERLREAATAIREEWDGGPHPMGTAWHRERDFHLAVADWLDGVAILLQGREDEEWLDLDGDPISPEDTHAIGSALTVARAYLGSAS